MKQYKDTRYFVDKMGNVFTNGKKLSARYDKDGYKMVSMYIGKEKKTFKVHRLVAETYIPNPENKPEVNHDDGNKENNFVGNLLWATSLENITHAIETGLRDTKGEMNAASKLTEKEVLEIREKFVPRKYTYKMLAEEYGVSQMTIYRITSNKKWKHI